MKQAGMYRRTTYPLINREKTTISICILLCLYGSLGSKFFLDYLIKTVNEMELMKTGDKRCTDFLREEITYLLMSTEQKAKHCRNVSYPLKHSQLTVVRRNKESGSISFQE